MELILVTNKMISLYDGIRRKFTLKIFDPIDLVEDFKHQEYGLEFPIINQIKLSVSQNRYDAELSPKLQHIRESLVEGYPLTITRESSVLLDAIGGLYLTDEQRFEESYRYVNVKNLQVDHTVTFGMVKIPIDLSTQLILPDVNSFQDLYGERSDGRVLLVVTYDHRLLLIKIFNDNRINIEDITEHLRPHSIVGVEMKQRWIILNTENDSIIVCKVKDRETLPWFGDLRQFASVAAGSLTFFDIPTPSSVQRIHEASMRAENFLVLFTDGRFLMNQKSKGFDYLQSISTDIEDFQVGILSDIIIEKTINGDFYQISWDVRNSDLKIGKRKLDIPSNYTLTPQFPSRVKSAQSWF